LQNNYNPCYISAESSSEPLAASFWQAPGKPLAAENMARMDGSVTDGRPLQILDHPKGTPDDEYDE